MNYKEYNKIKDGNYCSVGMFGENIYVFEQPTGFADTPVYIQITKNEFESFSGNDCFGERKRLCSGYKGDGDFDMTMVLSDDKIEQKKKDKSLWRTGVYSKEYYDGQGVVVLDFIPYKLTKRAYEDEPANTSLLSGYENVKMGCLWILAFEEVEQKKHPKGTYCEITRCNTCGTEFYFCDVNSDNEKYKVQCPECKGIF